MKLAIATNNQHKLQEIKSILGDSFEEILSLKDLCIDIDIEETGTTFEENALIKARTIATLCNIPALGDDTGLMVYALDGAPGVYSARYAGEQHDDKQNRKLLLYNMQSHDDRHAHFETAIVIYYPNGHFITAKGQVEGEILREERGNGGFGYDSLFYSNEIGKTFAEASQEEKNSVSHRGRALRNMLELLRGQNNA